jgi:hypothetical protein
MFFAGNTSKRGFSTRNCKESARMAFLRTSLAAVRALVSGSRPVLALAMLGLAVVGAMPAAVQAKALASASIEINRLVWYRAIGASPGASDPILTTRFLQPQPPSQPQQETVLRGGSEFFQFSGALDGEGYSAFADRFISTSAGLAPLTAGPECRGAGCPGPSDFNPLLPPPISDFAGNYGAVDGYFSSMPNNPSITTGLTQGVRSDVSLDSVESGSSEGLWDSSTILDSIGTFNTYFIIEYAAQALAYADGPGYSSEAEAVLSLSVSGGNNGLSPSLTGMPAIPSSS